MSLSKKLAVVGKDCVACGNCAKKCPLNAIQIYHGLCAVVDVSRCVGCGKCAVACPASVIDITAREAEAV